MAAALTNQVQPPHPLKVTLFKKNNLELLVQISNFVFDNCNKKGRFIRNVLIIGQWLLPRRKNINILKMLIGPSNVTEGSGSGTCRPVTVKVGPIA